MTSASNWLLSISSSRMTGLCLVGFAVFIMLVLPRQSERAALRSAGSGSPDTAFVYSVDDLYLMASAYGQDGRKDYILERFTFDLIWPVVYTIFLITCTSWLTVRIINTGSGWRRANLVPLIAAGADYLENILASIVMFRYPALTPVFDLLTPVATIVKWLLVLISFILLLVFLVLWVFRLMRRKVIA